MLKKHIVSGGICLALILLLIATFQYPGGSLHDVRAAGFRWQHNYLCNLTDAKAVNGQPNAAQPWASGAVLLLCISIALFFIRFSTKMPTAGVANVVRYAGLGSMAAALFIITPYHNIAVNISGTLLLLSLFYIAVYVFKSKLYYLKIHSVVSLLVFYATNFVYYAQISLALLPILQKLTLFLVISWLLWLDYGTKKEDFQPGGNRRKQQL